MTAYEPKLSSFSSQFNLAAICNRAVDVLKKTGKMAMDVGKDMIANRLGEQFMKVATIGLASLTIATAVPPTTIPIITALSTGFAAEVVKVMVGSAAVSIGTGIAKAGIDAIKPIFEKPKVIEKIAEKPVVTYAPV